MRVINASLIEFKLEGEFEKLRERLLKDKDNPRLARPLADWALASDRRLPLAILGWSLQEILSTPFPSLFGIPGIGEKKIRTMLSLLERACEDNVESWQQLLDSSANSFTTEPVVAEEVDPAMVSESSWMTWRATVIRHNLGREALGRFAPSLQELPKVLWRQPLGRYTSLSLSQMRNLKTHGEKRVAAVIRTFAGIQQLLGGQAGQVFELRLVPQAVKQVEDWLLRTLPSNRRIEKAELIDAVIKPLLEQVACDGGEKLAQLALSRLGIEGNVLSVRQSALEMKLTRARVYQLLSEIALIIEVRWPEGRFLFEELGRQWPARSARDADADLLRRTTDLFFPNPATANQESLETETAFV